MKKAIIVLAVASASFGSGWYVNGLRWEKIHADYQASEINRQNEARKKWESRLDGAELALSDSVAALSRSRDELEWMRQRVNDLERDAKTAEARWGARCAKLAVRYREAVERAKPALRYCAEILK